MLWVRAVFPQPRLLETTRIHTPGSSKSPVRRKADRAKREVSTYRLLSKPLRFRHPCWFLSRARLCPYPPVADLQPATPFATRLPFLGSAGLCPAAILARSTLRPLCRHLCSRTCLPVGRVRLPTCRRRGTLEDERALHGCPIHSCARQGSLPGGAVSQRRLTAPRRAPLGSCPPAVSTSRLQLGWGALDNKPHPQE